MRSDGRALDGVQPMAFHEKLHPSASASVAPNATARPATRQSSTRGMLQSTFFVALKRSPLSCDETVAHRRQTRCRTSCACSCACVVILSCYAHSHVVRRLWISTDPNGRVHYGRCTDTVSPSSSVSGRSQCQSINQSFRDRPNEPGRCSHFIGCLLVRLLSSPQ